MTLDDCRQVAARIWCDKAFSHVTMDVDVAEEIARKLFVVQSRQWFANDVSAKSTIETLLTLLSSWIKSGELFPPNNDEWSNKQKQDMMITYCLFKESLVIK